MKPEKCVKDELNYNPLEDKEEPKKIIEGINLEGINQEDINQEDIKQEDIKQEDIKTEIKTEQPQKYKNYKEKLYDKIPISLKTLDIIITILITIFVILMLYFIIRNF
jgi:hypothetical protein